MQYFSRKRSSHASGSATRTAKPQLKISEDMSRSSRRSKVVYVPIEDLAFYLALYLTSVHFRGKLQHISHLGKQKFKIRPIRTQEIAGLGL